MLTSQKVILDERVVALLPFKIKSDQNGSKKSIEA
jgi:hypothetical protein